MIVAPLGAVRRERDFEIDLERRHSKPSLVGPMQPVIRAPHTTAHTIVSSLPTIISRRVALGQSLDRLISIRESRAAWIQSHPAETGRTLDAGCESKGYLREVGLVP